MSASRLLEVAGLDLAHAVRRPLFWVQVVLLAFVAWGLSNGNVSIASGDARVGGQKAWITSEFAITQTLILLTCILYVFFISVGAGMALVRDDEHRVGELLRSTPLRPDEYVWGKYLAVLVSFAAVLALHLVFMVFFNHAVPHGDNADYIGPLVWTAYARPALWFGLPVLVLFTGACFAIGALTRRPVLVFSFPVAVLMLGMFFLWDWSPEWLPEHWNRVLQFVDLTGLRWINETWLVVDRGVAFYNHAAVGLDALIVMQRLFAIALGLGLVSWTARHEARAAQRTRVTREVAERALAAATAPRPEAAVRVPPPLAALGMSRGVPGWLASTFEVARTELHGLFRQPGLYLFVPLIVLQTSNNALLVGAFDTPLLHTPGSLAVASMNTLTLLVCMLLLFYTAESLQRERSTGLAPVLYSTSLPTGALLAGKALANAALGVAVVLACLVTCMVILLVQGRVAPDLGPFALVWGGLLLPTFLFWTSFVTACFAITGNRYGTYAIGFGAMVLTGWAQSRDHVTWALNWNLWGVARWSDIATFEYDRLPLLLNRGMVLALAVLLTVVALRAFDRRERDAARWLDSMRPGALARGVLGLAPVLLVPALLGTLLGLRVHDGQGGGRQTKLERDYWKRNVLTWRDAPTPSLTAMDLDVRLDPPRHGLSVRGHYDLINHTADTLARFPISINPRWEDASWNEGGARCSTENRSGLLVVTPRRPLAPGERMRFGFSYSGRVPEGITRNGGAQMSFILPSSIVLSGFANVSFLPQLGYFPEVGVEPDRNAADPREWDPHWHHGPSRAGIPMAGNWMDTRIRVDVPEDLQVNATGEKTSEKVAGGRRITEWVSDHPVRIVNLVAGRWQVARRPGVEVHYDPRHAYNVEEMLDALEGARRWFGEWFGPLPWRTLRLSEFAGLPTYAQAPPGNITFSENIGFLTKSEPEASAAFWITAHEAAHQWWPNVAMGADGPGSEVLSEGLAHFSTILLVEQMRGERQRLAWCRQIEDRYANIRRRDGERPLVLVDGTLPAESRIIYDKGGWAFWMLHQFQGRERSLAALREYLATFRDGDDYAALQDFLAIQRRHSVDTVGFDAIARQWFHEVVVPHYLVREATLTREGDQWRVDAVVANVGTGRMEVPVAAERGERFADRSEDGDVERYQRAMVRLVLGPGEEGRIQIRSKFQPTRLVVDPDVTVLMLERKKATASLAPAGTRIAAR